MTNRFYAGQTNYIEEMNALDGETGDHIADATGAHAATAISNTPAGNIAATTVQAAINELDTEKLSASATTLPASFTASSLTSVGTLTALTVSGQASFAAGSAAAPSVRVGAEQNGLYSSAANTLDVTLGGVRQFQFARTASAVNYPQFTGSATGGYIGFAAAGSDTNVTARYRTQGTGSHQFETGSSGNIALLLSHTASAVNFASITGAATGNAVRYGVEGSDSNVTWAASSKGTFRLGFYTDSFSQLQFAVDHIASAVNYLLVQGSGTGSIPTLSAQGADANIGVAIASKGFGNVGIYTGAGAVGSFFVTHTASGVNWVQTTGSTTGNAVSLIAGGSDTNIDMLLAPKGTGVLRVSGDSIRILSSKTPASASATGSQGQIAWDASYIYVCTAANTWKRAAIATW